MSKFRQPGKRAVLTETCFGEDGVRAALARAYAALDQIHFTVTFMGIGSPKANSRIDVPSLGAAGGNPVPMFLVAATGLHRHPERLREANARAGRPEFDKERTRDGTGEETPG